MKAAGDKRGDDLDDARWAGQSSFKEARQQLQWFSVLLTYDSVWHWLPIFTNSFVRSTRMNRW